MSALPSGLISNITCLRGRAASRAPRQCFFEFLPCRPQPRIRGVDRDFDQFRYFRSRHFLELRQDEHLALGLVHLVEETRKESHFVGLEGVVERRVLAKVKRLARQALRESRALANMAGTVMGAR